MRDNKYTPEDLKMMHMNENKQSNRMLERLIELTEKEANNNEKVY